mgnify:CR=1 FL=1
MSAGKAKAKHMSSVPIKHGASPAIPRSSHASRAANERRQQRRTPERRTMHEVDRIRIKRAYDAVTAQDGHRVLVDRIWPRGLSRDVLRIESWLKKIAPSTTLRKWFGHEPEKWDDFRAKYAEELRRKPDEITFLLELAREGIVTLVYAARDEAHNNALALAEYLRGLEYISGRN